MSSPSQNTIWPDLPARLVARMLSAHAGIGVVLGALLYIVSLSGVLIVFHAEFARWEQPDAPEMHTVTPDLAARAAQTVFDYAVAEDGAPASVQVFLPTASSPRLAAGYGDSYWFITPDGALADPIDHGFSEFLIDLHYYLHLPSTLGLIVVGLLGVMMLALVASGFLAHPRVLRDAFRTARGGNAQLSLADRHNRLSVWAAPFHIMMPLTGAALGLAGIVATALAVTQPGEDASSLFDSIFGASVTQTAPAGALPDVAQAIRAVDATYGEAGLYPWIVQIDSPGQDGQSLQMIVDAPQRLIFGEYIQFSPDGQIIGKTGLEDGGFGQQAAASIYNLHFGNWAGLPMKLVYVALGLALCVVCASGVQLWLLKRARKKGPQPVLERSWTALVWSPPALIGLILSLDRLAGLPDSAMPAVFWLGLFMLTLMACFIPSQPALSRTLRGGGGVLVSVGALAHFADYGLAGYHSPAAWGVMLGMMAAGAVLILSALVSHAKLTPAPAQALAE